MVIVIGILGCTIRIAAVVVGVEGEVQNIFGAQYIHQIERKLMCDFFRVDFIADFEIESEVGIELVAVVIVAVIHQFSAVSRSGRVDIAVPSSSGGSDFGS